MNYPFNFQQLIRSDWAIVLKNEFEKLYFRQLDDFLNNEYSLKKIYPDKKNIFAALNLTPFSEVKVVILGQDPYHGSRQANGLSFSVNHLIKIPPSLRNIIKELKNDLHIPEPLHGDLSCWAKQGVLLLNDTLTVREAEANSHKNKGWEEFTTAIIKSINEHKKNVVFILWGKKAEKKAMYIDKKKHKVFKSDHPSPLSAYRGFFGNHHFSRANAFLIDSGQKSINWEII